MTSTDPIVPSGPAVAAGPAVPAVPAYDGPRAEIGVVGGSGLYTFLEDAIEVHVPTPWGDPSDALVLGSVEGRGVAFLPRHGRGHRFPPHRINYRANLWALRTVGVRQVLAPSAVGSLLPGIGPGSVVVPDQLIDRTWGRSHTYFDGSDGVGHVMFAEPYCPTGRATVTSTAAGQQLEPVDGGTLVVIDGPRFSTRAESVWHRSAGGSVVGMTGMPEAGLARELALCYTSISLVTDHDAGVDVEGGAPVTHAEVLRVFADNVARVRELLHAAIPALPVDRDGCACGQALEGLDLPFALP